MVLTQHALYVILESHSKTICNTPSLRVVSASYDQVVLMIHWLKVRIDVAIIFGFPTKLVLQEVLGLTSG
jgi:hypothetical protein